MTDTSTRQRLLELLEKCPECRPKGLDWRRVDSLVTIAHWELGVHFISTKDAFALARDAMTECLEDWLSPKGGILGTWKQHGERHVVVAGKDHVAASRTDALISAVEAVLND